MKRFLMVAAATALSLGMSATAAGAQTLNLKPPLPPVLDPGEWCLVVQDGVLIEVPCATLPPGATAGMAQRR